jgi:starch synthase (maltosyl-transferring)
LLLLRSRVVIENIQPSVDAGQFPVKRIVGDEVRVTADIHADGHDHLAAILKIRQKGQATWTVTPLRPLPNDVWEGSFVVSHMGDYEYTLEAWVDRFSTWHAGLLKKIEASQDIAEDLLEGAALVDAAAANATGPQASFLKEQSRLVRAAQKAPRTATAALFDGLLAPMAAFGERGTPTVYDPALKLNVERERARFGAWYEFFPRSAGATAERSATFREAEARLGGISALGFDVVYLPPVHPIGKSFRKGPNNATRHNPGDPGSPWAIGSAEGGHKAIHPELGTLDDFDRFVAAAHRKNLEIALDLAFQCSPDHPYVHEHPEWFRHRPNGAIKYAENPPKKYEDIYPLDFEGAAWESLWKELCDVVLFWVDHGVTIFRVDNPHTKPYRFWEWLIQQVRAKHPEIIFLAEAFTRPKVMAQLAKGGFSQSYSYFTWRTTKPELTTYFTELTQGPEREYMRPNLFANTPDIFHAFLQTGGRPGFLIRLFLAATLGASYGIYGPPFELCEANAIPGTEDYQDSEKYQIRVWDLDRPGNIKDWIKKINGIRHAQPALQTDHPLRFVESSNEHLIAYVKTTPAGTHPLLTLVNLDPQQPHDGWVRFLPPGLASDATYEVHDLLSDARYVWHGDWNYIRLDPQVCPAHIFAFEALP